jgi:hypothetical protein
MYVVRDRVALCHLCVQCSFIVILTKQKPDNLITTPSGKMYLCDVAIVQPACPTHVNKGQERLGASKAAAVEKHRQYDAMAAARRACMTPCIAEVYGALDEPFINFMKELTALAEYNDWCAWSREEALQAMSGAIGVAIQLGNALALDAVQCKNRKRGLTAAAPRPVPVPVPAPVPVPSPSPVIDADDEQSNIIGDDSDHDHIRFPVDHPLIGVHSARVIIPLSDSQSQSQSLSHNNNNIDRGRGNSDAQGNGGAHLAVDGAAG